MGDVKPVCVFNNKKTTCAFTDVTLPNDQGLPRTGATVVVRKQPDQTEAQVRISFQDGSVAEGTITCGNTSGFVQSNDRSLWVTLQERRTSRSYRPYYGKHFEECPVVLQRLRNLLVRKAQPPPLPKQTDRAASPVYHRVAE